MSNVSTYDEMLSYLSEATKHQYHFLYDIDNKYYLFSNSSLTFFKLNEQICKNISYPLKNVVHSNYISNVLSEINNIVLGSKKEVYMYFKLVNNTTNTYNATCRGKKINGNNGKYIAFTVTVHEEDTMYDDLTNLPNFNKFFINIDELNTVNKGYSSIAFDIKGYSNINFKYGYEFGNKLLYNLSNEVNKIVSSYGILHRIEGTMFVLLSPQVLSSTELKKIHSDIRLLLSRFSMDGYILNIEIYSGAVVTNIVNEPQLFLSAIVSAVEKSKDNESAQLTIFDDEKCKNTYQTLTLLDEVIASINSNYNGFYLVYQPFVSTLSGDIIGAEALLRFKNDTYGEVSPYIFIEYIENHTCFYELGLWIIRQALTDAKNIMKYKPNFFININLSYSQLEREEFKYDVINIIEELDFPYDKVQFEITERCKSLDLKYLYNLLEFFRNYNIKIALDDFGTGTSSLSLICELPIDCVKIDKSFILNIINNKSNQIIVEAVIQCARSLNINVCLEGVENDEITKFVSRYNANYYQGYNFSIPVVIEEFMDILFKNWNIYEFKLLSGESSDIFDINNVLSMMPGGFYIYSKYHNEKIITANQALLDIYECKTSQEFIELTGLSFKGLVHPDDYERVTEEIYNQINNNNQYDRVIYRIITKTGKIKVVYDYGHLVTIDGENDLFYVFIAEQNKKF